MAPQAQQAHRRGCRRAASSARRFRSSRQSMPDIVPSLCIHTVRWCRPSPQHTSYNRDNPLPLRVLVREGQGRRVPAGYGANWS
jgi:hypothetical protein